MELNYGLVWTTWKDDISSLEALQIDEDYPPKKLFNIMDETNQQYSFITAATRKNTDIGLYLSGTGDDVNFGESDLTSTVS